MFIEVGFRILRWEERGFSLSGFVSWKQSLCSFLIGIITPILTFNCEVVGEVAGCNLQMGKCRAGNSPTAALLCKGSFKPEI